MVIAEYDSVPAGASRPLAHRSALVVLALAGVALGGCAVASEPDAAQSSASGSPASVAQAIDEQPEADEAEAGAVEVREPPPPGDFAGAPGYGIPREPFIEGDLLGGPGYGTMGGYGPMGGPGYVVGGPGYVEGCDELGNCFRRSEWGGGFPGGYGYGRSASYSSRSGAMCDTFGCVYY